MLSIITKLSKLVNYPKLAPRQIRIYKNCINGDQQNNRFANSYQNRINHDDYARISTHENDDSCLDGKITNLDKNLDRLVTMSRLYKQSIIRVKEEQILTRQKTINKFNKGVHSSMYKNRVVYNFSENKNNTYGPKLTKQQLESAATFEQLVDKIVTLYNFKQYKIPSTLALLEVHHQFKVFNAGDWVLDIGSAPNWSWTDLALKLTHGKTSNPLYVNSSNIKLKSNFVISNDLHENKIEKQNSIHINGNFMQEPVQTKIAMNLLDRQLDTILIDATPQYSGNQQIDASYTLQVYVKALQFSKNYLKKGGTIIFRTIQSTLSLLNQKQSKFFFNQVYRYKPSNFHIDSPSFFYIMKGYMMTQNLAALESMLKQYHSAKTNFGKIQTVQKYRAKYQWDPVQLLNNQAKQNIYKLKKQGKKNNQILKKYESDPFVKAKQIIDLIDILQSQQKSNNNPIQKIKAQRKLLTGSDKLQQVGFDLPKNKQQFAQLLFKNVQQIQNQMKEQEQKRKKKKKQKQLRKFGIRRKDSKIKKQKNVLQKAPLGQNQIYMKSTKVNQQQDQSENETSEKQYRKQDLYGYDPQDPARPINKIKSQNKQQQDMQNQTDFIKFVQSFPEVKRALERNNKQSIFELQDEMQKSNDFFKDLFEQQKKSINKQSQKQGKQKNSSQNWFEQVYNQSTNKKKNKKQFFKEDQEQQMQDQSAQNMNNSQDPLKTKSYQRNKMRENIKSKSQQQQDIMKQQSQMNIDKILSEKNKQYDRQQTLREMAEQSKNQYFTGKPKKADRPKNYQNKSKKNQQPQSGGSYFKQKNKKDKTKY